MNEKYVQYILSMNYSRLKILKMTILNNHGFSNESPDCMKNSVNKYNFIVLLSL